MLLTLTGGGGLLDKFTSALSAVILSNFLVSLNTSWFTFFNL